MTDKAPEGASEADQGKGVMADSAMGEAFQCYPYVLVVHASLIAAESKRLTRRLPLQHRRRHRVPH